MFNLHLKFNLNFLTFSALCKSHNKRLDYLLKSNIIYLSGAKDPSCLGCVQWGSREVKAREALWCLVEINVDGGQRMEQKQNKIV